MSNAARINAFLERERPAQTAFLAELVKVPSDNPPGDCAAHARRAEALLAELGLAVEPHPVPEALAHATGVVWCTTPPARRAFGEGGPTIAHNAHGDMVPPAEGDAKPP